MGSLIAFTRFRQASPRRTQVDFRLSACTEFSATSARESWRWSWDTRCVPAVNQIDVLMVRSVLMDHLAAQVTQINGHTGVPFVLSTMNNVHNWNWTMVAMGFVGQGSRLRGRAGVAGR